MTYQHPGVIVPLSGYWDYKGNNHHKENWSIVESYINILINVEMEGTKFSHQRKYCCQALPEQSPSSTIA